MFEPYIEPEPPANQENTPIPAAIPVAVVTPAATPTPVRVNLKPSPVKNHTPPLSFKKQMAGKTLKASLLDAFNDAVFGFPKRKVPRKKADDTPAEPTPLQQNSGDNQTPAKS